MPAMPNVSKVVRVDHHFSLAADANMQFREFYQYSGSLSSTDASTWLTNIVTGLTTNVVPLMSSACSLISSELTDLTTNTAPQVINATGAAGGDNNAILDAGTACILQHHVLRRYRGGHSRVYLPGFTSERLLNATQWTSSFINSILGGYNAYLTAATANTNPAAIGTILHVNVSFFQGFTNHTYPSGRVRSIPTLRVTPLVDQIASTAVNPRPGSQRRRNKQSA